MAGDYGSTGTYSTTTAMKAPASVIYLALAQDDVAPRDHFHPFYWGTPPERSSMMMGPVVWDAAKDETKELKLRAFGDGATCRAGSTQGRSIRATREGRTSDGSARPA